MVISMNTKTKVENSNFSIKDLKINGKIILKEIKKEIEVKYSGLMKKLGYL